MQSHHVVDGAGRPMISRNPFRIHQGDRSRIDRDSYRGMQNVARRIRGVNAQTFVDGLGRSEAAQQQEYKEPNNFHEVSVKVLDFLLCSSVETRSLSQSFSVLLSFEILSTGEDSSVAAEGGCAP